MIKSSRLIFIFLLINLENYSENKDRGCKITQFYLNIYDISTKNNRHVQGQTRVEIKIIV